MDDDLSDLYDSYYSDDAFASEPSGGLGDFLRRGESVIGRVDSTLTSTERAASTAGRIASKPAMQVALAFGVVIAVGVGAYLWSQSRDSTS